MPAAVRYGSIKRFGARYGRKIKYKIGKVEEERKRSKQCPYCRKPGIKRLAVGIWNCTKCSSKFAGKAYVPGGGLTKEGMLIEEAAEAEEVV